MNLKNLLMFLVCVNFLGTAPVKRRRKNPSPFLFVCGKIKT